MICIMKSDLLFEEMVKSLIGSTCHGWEHFDDGISPSFPFFLLHVDDDDNGPRIEEEKTGAQ
jgi:hypothetical protein